MYRLTDAIRMVDHTRIQCIPILTGVSHHWESLTCKCSWCLVKLTAAGFIPMITWRKQWECGQVNNSFISGVYMVYMHDMHVEWATTVHWSTLSSHNYSASAKHDILLYTMLCHVIGSWSFMFPGDGWICYSCYTVLVENSGICARKSYWDFTVQMKPADSRKTHCHQEYIQNMCILYTVYIYNWKGIHNLENKWEITSSTAQGGGGSFKNRKSIGRVCRACRRMGTGPSEKNSMQGKDVHWGLPLHAELWGGEV